MAEVAVAKEVAEQDFARMCRARRIETDLEMLDPVAREVFALRKQRVLRAIMRGLCTVNEAGDPTYTPPDGKAYTFHKLTGAAFIASDGKGPNETIAEMFSQSTRTNPGEAAKLDAPDYQFVNELIHLFLGR